MNKSQESNLDNNYCKLKTSEMRINVDSKRMLNRYAAFNLLQVTIRIAAPHSLFLLFHTTRIELALRN